MERLIITQKGLPLYDLPSDVELYTLFSKELSPLILEPDEVFLLAKGMRDFYPRGASALSGYAYLGQFLAHDISRLRRGGHDLQPPGFTDDPIISGTTAALDLSSVYDGATEDSQLRLPGTAYMRLGAALGIHGERIDGYDLPRHKGQADIADQRNDENFIVSQLHLQFLRLHNFFVDELKSAFQSHETEALFDAAKTQTTLHFQDVILHDFLYEVLHPDVWKALVYKREGIIWEPGTSESAVLPVEYTGAAGRFGHSMVRDSYHLNREASVDLRELFQLTGEGRLGAEPDIKNGVPATHLIDWLLFFDFPKYTTRVRIPAEPNRAIRISPRVRIKLEHTASLAFKGSTHLAIRNLHRGIQLGMASAQDIIDYTLDHHAALLGQQGIELKAMTRVEMGSERNYPPLRFCDRLYENTPLWFYILSEAYLDTPDGKGKLGVLGSLIMADSIMGLLKLDPNSILNQSRRTDLIPQTKLIKRVSEQPFLQMSDLILAATKDLPDPALFSTRH